MSGLHPSIPLDPLWVNVTFSPTWSVPVDWWPIIGAVVGFIFGAMLAGVLIPWRRSP